MGSQVRGGGGGGSGGGGGGGGELVTNRARVRWKYVGTA